MSSQHDLGIGAQYGARGEFALQHPAPADAGLGARNALDVMQRRLAVASLFDHVLMAARRAAQSQQFEFDTDLPQQLLPARAA